MHGLCPGIRLQRTVEPTGRRPDLVLGRLGRPAAEESRRGRLLPRRRVVSAPYAEPLLGRARDPRPPRVLLGRRTRIVRKDLAVALRLGLLEARSEAVVLGDRLLVVAVAVHLG